MGTGSGGRRTELAAFLRSRRERRTPQDVGLPPGFRRRTPGLRREEVALLAGVGVTWYTWLEQGRPINASVQVLDAVARTLGLDTAERTHLYRLAGVPWITRPEVDTPLPEDIQVILDGLDPLPAAVYNARYDLLAWNHTYRKVFPGLVGRERAERNVLWCTFNIAECCSPFVEQEYEWARLVAELHTAFGRHVGEPEWESFVARLAEVSGDFTRLWALREVVKPQRHIQRLRHPALGELRLATTRMHLAVPETRMVVYTPADEETRRRVERLAAMVDSHACCDSCRARSRIPGPGGVATRSTANAMDVTA